MIIAEEFSRANCGAVGGPMMVHSDIVCHYILNNGSEEQKQRYLPDMVSGACVGAVAMTEPGRRVVCSKFLYDFPQNNSTACRIDHKRVGVA